jgi:hypothetical protein
MTALLPFLTPLGAILLLALIWSGRFSSLTLGIGLAGGVALIASAQAPYELALTIAIEAALISALTLTMKLAPLRLVVASLLLNDLTNPVLSVLLHSVGDAHWFSGFLVGEILVFVAEALLYAGLIATPFTQRSLTQGFWLSLLANGASAAVGLLLPM